MTSLLLNPLRPNTITLAGLMAIVANDILAVILVPDFRGNGPRWLYFSFAAGLWIYSTLDNCDGKQARRTQRSSPLGELFDHGIDSLNCTLAGLLQCAALAAGSTPTGAFLVLISTAPMYLSSWEQYHTRILFLGFVNGPTEGIMLACIMMVISGLYGKCTKIFKKAD